jgi:hypothetical protein
MTAPVIVSIKLKKRARLLLRKFMILSVSWSKPWAADFVLPTNRAQTRMETAHENLRFGKKFGKLSVV